MREQKRNARKQILVGKQADGIYVSKEKDLKQYKREASAIAKDFGYETVMPDVYDRIKKATSCLQVANIMTYCRKAS
jgi:hypothetical protein